MSIIGVGVAYLLQEMGLIIPSVTTVINTLASALPWFAGILIILLGFGVLGWKPKRKKSKTGNLEKKVKKEVKVEEYTVKPESSKRKLVKSRNKKLAGVAGGLAEYFGVDPTLIRIAFVIATVFGGGFPAIPLYIVLALVMSKPDSTGERPSKNKPEEKIIVIRESP
jgi:phage shock protein PspC (stress-responsive transcriptional regulator)